PKPTLGWHCHREQKSMRFGHGHHIEQPQY
ncbi:hypothetical protein D039_4908B, partial [Vibrio parahaemolyticus EKP-028]